jgi:hypothetical protein
MTAVVEQDIVEVLTNYIYVGTHSLDLSHSIFLTNCCDLLIKIQIVEIELIRSLHLIQYL